LGTDEHPEAVPSPVAFAWHGAMPGSKYEVTSLPGQNNDSQTEKPQKVEAGRLLYGRWRLSREKPLFQDETSTVYRARDARTSKDVALKVYRDSGPVSLQKFRKSVELLLTFRGRFNEKGMRVEGSQNLDLLLEELRSQTSLADYATAQSFITNMSFRSCFVEIICFSHDKDWNPAVDPESNLLFIVMEMGEMSLRERMNECIHTKSSLTITEIQSVHWALVSLVCGLHSEGYMHLDVKPSTLFRFTVGQTKSGKPKHLWKLIDLDGVVRSGAQMRLVDLPYAADYAPPELAQCYLRSQREGGKIKVERKMNVWSAGMCALEAVSLMPVLSVKYSWYQKWKQTKGGNTNFMAALAGEKSNLGIEKIIPQDLLEGMRFVNPDMAHLVETMLVKEPKHRHSIGQCLLHKWFEPKRKAVFNARWGIEEDSEEEEELDAHGKRKKKPKWDDDEEDPVPHEAAPLDIQAYIKESPSRLRRTLSPWYLGPEDRPLRGRSGIEAQLAKSAGEEPADKELAPAPAPALEDQPSGKRRSKKKDKQTNSKSCSIM